MPGWAQVGGASCPTPDIREIHDSESEPDEFGTCHGITDASALKLSQLESAHDQLSDQVDGIQNSVQQLLASQASLAQGLVRVDSGLAAAAAQQHDDRTTAAAQQNDTQQALQLILQRLQHFPVSNPAPVQPKAEPDAPTSSPATAAPGPSHSGSPATTAPLGSADVAAPPGSEPTWVPTAADSLDVKGTGKGKDDSCRPAQAPFY